MFLIVSVVCIFGLAYIAHYWKSKASSKDVAISSLKREIEILAQRHHQRGCDFDMLRKDSCIEYGINEHYSHYTVYMLKITTSGNYKVLIKRFDKDGDPLFALWEAEELLEKLREE